MKNTFTLIVSATILFLAACGGGNDIAAKKEQLEKLKAEQAELASEIATLQEEIAKGGDSATTENNRAKTIALSPVTTQEFVHAIDIQGRVDGDENITYSAKVPSVVTRILVKAGDRVGPGQILANLDGSVLLAQLDALKKSYELVNTLYEKRKALWDQKVGSEVEFLQAKNQKESLEKQIVASKEALDMYYIKADYAGTIDEVIIKVGQNVAPGVPTFTVVNPDRLKVKADLSESYASQVKTGNIAQIRFPDIDKSVSAKVTYASRSINAMTRTFNVEMNLTGDNDLHPNMVAEVKIFDYEKKDAIVVPINSIQEIDGVNVVFVAVKEGSELVAKKLTVTVGKMYNGKAEVLSGLNVGDQLITTGFQDLTDGQALKL
jgi:membrane fusion protein (multidrug efflux system)